MSRPERASRALTEAEAENAEAQALPALAQRRPGLELPLAREQQRVASAAEAEAREAAELVAMQEELQEHRRSIAGGALGTQAVILRGCMHACSHCPASCHSICPAHLHTIITQA